MSVKWKSARICNDDFILYLKIDSSDSSDRNPGASRRMDKGAADDRLITRSNAYAVDFMRSEWYSRYAKQGRR